MVDCEVVGDDSGSFRRFTAVGCVLPGAGIHAAGSPFKIRMRLSAKNAGDLVSSCRTRSILCLVQAHPAAGQGADSEMAPGFPRRRSFSSAERPLPQGCTFHGSLNSHNPT